MSKLKSRAATHQSSRRGHLKFTHDVPSKSDRSSADSSPVRVGNAVGCSDTIVIIGAQSGLLEVTAA